MKVWEYESKEDDNLAKQQDKDPNISMTKPEMAVYLISLVDLKDGDRVMEPCRGTGSFYDNLPTFTDNYYCEINEGIDYLTQNQNVDYTISNPPFVPRKLFWSFFVKAMETTDKEIWWLINISSLNVFTKNRITYMNDNNWYLNKMYVVGDKRWFGRYVWCKFSRDNKDFMVWGDTF